MCVRAARSIYLSPQERRVIPWFGDQGDKTLRVNYDLNEHSLVFDLGGYEGQWASDIFAMYACSIYIFEPVQQYADHIARRFHKNKKIYVHDFGLASSNRLERITIAQDGSSLFKQGKASQEVRLVSIIDFLRERDIHQIDLMKINIEGGEYELLEHLIATNWIRHIRNLQVQFHDFIPNAEQRMRRIQAGLAQTHSLTYQYVFVWENWRLKTPR